jgi:hypothetical protein
MRWQRPPAAGDQGPGSWRHSPSAAELRGRHRYSVNVPRETVIRAVVLRRQLGWTAAGRARAPRVHDLRHRMVVRRIQARHARTPGPQARRPRQAGTALHRDQSRVTARAMLPDLSAASLAGTGERAVCAPPVPLKPLPEPVDLAGTASEDRPCHRPAQARPPDAPPLHPALASASRTPATRITVAPIGQFYVTQCASRAGITDRDCRGRTAPVGPCPRLRRSSLNVKTSRILTWGFIAPGHFLCPVCPHVGSVLARVSGPGRGGLVQSGRIGARGRVAMAKLAGQLFRPMV